MDSCEVPGKLKKKKLPQSKVLQTIELDKLSKKYEEYKQDKDYDTKCKGRIKKTPKILKVVKGSNDNALCRYKSIDGIADNEVKFKTETQPNEQSHCLCLPKFQPIIVYVNLLLGDAPISNFGMMSTNSDTDGKSVNQNGNIESMNVSGTNPCYATSEYSGLQNNTNVHNGYQFGMISTNSTGSPIIDMSNSNSDTDAKLVNPNGNIESMNVNGADTCYAISEYNGLQNNMNVHDGLQK
ncbi:hypothetical protein HNY73_008639 [Argiope bruennichi]|uniref:Uncharacterized protein n=1 Tax=Argiope bruennichi TaxID=94029 RepID=A0A8T0FC50_ARGBR|nr:hypothetical protein HNY73_008639 [Argiope bruennichi]